MASQFLSPGQVIEPEPQQAVDEEWHENLNIHLICPECKEVPPNIVEETSSGDNVCGSCGLVLGERIVDTRSEWRTFANDDSGHDDPSRVGNAGDSLREDGLTTDISRVDGGKGARDLYRAHNRMQDKGKKSLGEVQARIQNICTVLRASDEDARIAGQLFKAVDDSKQFKSKSADVIIAGCLFLAFRQTGHHRTFKDISQVTGVQKKDVGKMFKVLKTFFSAQRAQRNSTTTGTNSVDARSFDTQEEEGNRKMVNLTDRYCNQLGLSTNMAMNVRALAEATMEKGVLDGRSPLSGAAACIYMISHLFGDPKTAKEIAGVAGVSDGTIKNAYKYLREQKDVLIRKDWLAPEGKGDMSKLPAA